MAQTLIEQVAVALQAAIAPAALAAAGAAGVTVYRDRAADVPSEKWPAIVQLDDDDDTPPPDQTNFGLDIYTIPVALVGYVGSTPAAPMTAAALAPALDALFGAVIKVALADPTFGNLAVDARLGHTQRALDRESGTVQGQFKVTIEIEIATQQGNPFSLPT